MSGSEKPTARRACCTPVFFAVSLNRRTTTATSLEQEPYFLIREQIDVIHRDQIEAWGGLHGVRSADALESAIAQPLNVYFYGNGDLYEIAAAYAFHIAESQAYFDGNKRTGVQAAADFLEINGIDTTPLP